MVMTRVAVLDDYLKLALASADWSVLADDTRAMLGALDRLGVGLRVDDERDPDVVVTVDGLGEGFTAEGDTLTLDVMQSGTTSRFLVPALAAGRGLTRR